MSNISETCYKEEQKGKSIESLTLVQAKQMPNVCFLQVIGQGHAGRVYLARLKGTDRMFAMKTLKKDVVQEKREIMVRAPVRVKTN